MAIIRNAANTLMKGRVGQTTYYISKGQQVARQSRNDSNYGESARRTELQQNRRVLWANLVQFYKISARWMPKAFETKGVGQTDYNKFMAVNVPTARIPLTKNQAEAGACVVDRFVVSQGSLPSIEVTALVSGWKTNLLIGDLTIGAETTVADLTNALVDNNANIRVGMQLSFASYQQSVDPLGTPRVNCRLYEVTLSPGDTSLVSEHIPLLGLSSVDGCIGTSADVPLGGFAWILSELQNGTLRVSTQLLTINNATLISQYTTAGQLQAAAESYGIDTEVILNPSATVEQSQEPDTPYIQYIMVGQTRYNPGDIMGSAGVLHDTNVEFHLSQPIASEIKFPAAYLYNSSVTPIVNGTVVSASGNIVTVSFSEVSAETNTRVSYFELQTDTLRLEIWVSEQQSGGGSGDMG